MDKPTYKKLEEQVKKLKKTLKKSHEKYRTLTDNIRVGIFRSTPGSAGNFIELNKTMVNMLGYTRKEELFNNPVSTIYQNPKDRIKFNIKITKNGFVENEELHLKKKNGTPIIVTESAIAVKNDKGELLYFVGIMEDITERKKNEEKIRLQRAYYEELIKSAPEAIVLHDNHDLVVNVNKEFTRLFGYSLDEARGKPINDLIAWGNYQSEARKLSSKVLRGKGVNVETKRKKKNGSLIDVSILGAPIFFDGRQIGVYAIYRDISERKKAEEKLQIQTSYLEELFNSTSEAIVLHDNYDIIVNINTEFTRLFGYSLDEAKGKPINDLIATGGAFFSEAKKLSSKVLKGEGVNVETKRCRKDGTLIDVRILGAPIFHDGKQVGVYAIYRDISERKDAEEIHKKALEQAKMARDIQINLLPKSNPHIPGYDVAGINIPALNVGGDYYDFITLDPHRVAICLGDVSGKGLPAALMMANLQATIRGQAFFYHSPKICLERSNKLLFHCTDKRTFISLFYGILDIHNNMLHYVNAGHNMPIVFLPNQESRQLQTRGIALGIKEKVIYTKDEIEIKTGDLLLIYSDGISEAMDERKIEFGDQKLKKIIEEYKNDPAAEIIKKILDAVNLHFGDTPQDDDITVIVLKRNA